MSDPKDRLLDAALAHVVFDGWSEATLRAAAEDCAMSPEEARTLFPRGALDLAVAFHRRGDDRMEELVAGLHLDGMRFREKVAAAVRCRLEAIAEREAVRRAAALFALPLYAPEGARLIWGTADRIWRLLGDTSEDVNWYSKRATLSAVYAATVLYWLGDESEGHQATWAFLDRRIEDVMRFEKAKARVSDSPALSRIFAGPAALASKLRAPGAGRPMPGRWERR